MCAACVRLSQMLGLLVVMLLCGCGMRSVIHSATVPRAADILAKEIDKQLVMRYSHCVNHKDEDIREAVSRAQFKIMGTTPVNLNTLTQSCPLARQMTEEVSSKLMSLGYRYEELRRGNVIRFDRRTGELILTRNVGSLYHKTGTGQAILAGTYVISDQHVRFSISLIHSVTNETMAKASASVPITPDILPLLDESPVGGNGGGFIPSIRTQLR